MATELTYEKGFRVRSVEQLARELRFVGLYVGDAVPKSWKGRPVVARVVIVLEVDPDE